MGFFNKIKNMFKGTEKEEVKKQESNKIDVEENIKEDSEDNSTKVVEKPKKIEDEVKQSVKVYEKGLTKARDGFVSKLAGLTNKYKKVTDEYFDELEEILIMADIGINTVMEFIDRLRDRVKSEKLDDPELLKEIIVD